MAIERLAPDVILAITNLSGVVGDIQDDPDSPDSNWLLASSNNADSIARVSFPSPTGNPTTGVGLQEFRVLVRKMGGTGTPDARIELWENGVLIREGSLIEIITDTVINFTWNASELGTPDGSLVECRLYGKKSGGGPSARATIEVGAIEWNVEYDEGVEEHSGSGSISGNGSFSGSIKKGGKGTGLASLSGLLVALGIVAMFGTAIISGGGSQVAVAKKAIQASTLISGGGSFVATGEKAEGEQHFGTATISEGGLLTLGGEKSSADSTTISANGTFLTPGKKSGLSFISISANGIVEATGEKEISDTIILSGNGTLVASGTAEEGEAHEGVASISGDGSLISTGEKGAYASTGITEQGGLIGTGLKETFGIGLISGAGSIVATGSEGEIIVIEEYHIDFDICRSIEFDLVVRREKKINLNVKREFLEELEI